LSSLGDLGYFFVYFSQEQIAKWGLVKDRHRQMGLSSF
jgi:hypothetical protein